MIYIIVNIKNDILANYLKNKYNIQENKINGIYTQLYFDNSKVGLLKYFDNIYTLINSNICINHKNKLELKIENNNFSTNYKTYYDNRILLDPIYYYNFLVGELLLSALNLKLNIISNSLIELYKYKMKLVNLLNSDFDSIDLENYNNLNCLINKYNIQYQKIYFSLLQI